MQRKAELILEVVEEALKIKKKGNEEEELLNSSIAIYISMSLGMNHIRWIFMCLIFLMWLVLIIQKSCVLVLYYMFKPPDNDMTPRS